MSNVQYFVVSLLANLPSSSATDGDMYFVKQNSGWYVWDAVAGQMKEVAAGGLTLPLAESNVTNLTANLATLTAAILAETARAEAAEVLLAPLLNPTFPNNLIVGNTLETAGMQIQNSLPELNFLADLSFSEIGVDGTGMFFGSYTSFPPCPTVFSDMLYLHFERPTAALSGAHAQGATVLHLAAPLALGAGTVIRLGTWTAGNGEWVTYVSGSGTTAITVSALANAHLNGESVQVTNDSTHPWEFRLQGGCGLTLVANSSVGGGVKWAGTSGIPDVGIFRPSPGVIEVGNGTPGDISGEIIAAVLSGGSGYLHIQNDLNHPIVFYVNGLEVGRFSSSGYSAQGDITLVAASPAGMIYNQNSGATQILLASLGTDWGGIQNDAPNVWSLAHGTLGTPALATPVISWTAAGRVGIGNILTPTQLLTLNVAGSLAWDNGAGTADVGLSRTGPNALALGNSTPGDKSGSLALASLIATSGITLGTTPQLESHGVAGVKILSGNSFNFYFDGNGNCFGINRDTVTGVVADSAAAALQLSALSSTTYGLYLYNGAGAYLCEVLALSPAGIQTKQVSLVSNSTNATGIFIAPSPFVAHDNGALWIWHSDGGNTTEYFDSNYDNAAAAMLFRMRVFGTPVNVLQLLGSGAVSAPSGPMSATAFEIGGVPIIDTGGNVTIATGAKLTWNGDTNITRASAGSLRIAPYNAITQLYDGVQNQRFEIWGSSSLVFTLDAAVGITSTLPIIVANPVTPASSSAAGTKGQQAWDANYIYQCVATNTWKRAALTTW